MKDMMSRHAYAVAVFGVLSVNAAHAQNNNPNSDTAEVMVTGSRIPTTQGEELAGVTVITSKELEDRGFRNAFDALNTLTQNTGFTQGADFGNTFTPAANTISLRGLGPNHTLILINGRRVADYPIAYDGSVNFVNLANIPSASIERLEILNGGASAIYGSDAIAGVVNIILKDHAEGLDVNVKAGTTERGGGGNGRVQAVGGATYDRLSTLFALEITRSEPIWAEQRDFMNSASLEGEQPYVVWGRQNLDSGNFVDPGANCAAFSKLFYASVAPYNTGGGNYCGSGKTLPTYWTTQTGNQSENLYGKLKYQLDEHTTLFTDLILDWDHTWNNTRTPRWISAGGSTGYFFNETSGDYEQWTRRFAPEEMGGVERYNKYWNDFSAMMTAGVQGEIGSSTWRYEAAYNASVYESREEIPLLLAGIDNYFLGPQLGVDGSGVPVYAPDPGRFEQPLTPAQFGSLFGHATSKDNSWLQNVNLTANGELFKVPAGALEAAAALEWGTQGFSNHADPLINQGIFYNTGQTEDASGSRSRYAAAVEFKVPLLRRLNARLAARFDDYSFAGRSEGKPTYNAGIEYRPIDSLQLHASYATSFRAPDMNYIFQARTLGYYADTTDYYLCGLNKLPLSNCPYANMSPGANFTQIGSRNLGFENGRSFDYGVVFTPLANLRLSLDYWNLRIDNEVTLIDADMLLRIEAECRLGQLDITSAQCVDALSRVQRNPPNAVLNPNAITNITVNPINASFERTDGIDVGATLNWSAGGIGNFLWSTHYTRVMSHYYQQFATDQPIDLVRSFDNPNGDSDFPDKLTTTLRWSLRSWSATLEVDRFGSIINQAQTAFLTPTALVNLSAQYRFGNGSVALIVNNLFDTIKKDDSAGWPYYPVGYFLPYGRQGWVEFSWHFGPKG